MKDVRQKRLERAIRRNDARDAINALRADYWRRQVELAQWFHEVDRGLHYVYESCSSIRQFGELHGFAGVTASFTSGATSVSASLWLSLTTPGPATR